MPRAYTGSQYSAPVPDASAFAINSADDTKQVRVNLNPLAPNTTAVITVTGPGTFPDPGTGGVVIGAAVTGGVAGRVLFEGAGPVVADDAGLTYNAATDALTVVGSFNGPGTGLTGTAAGLSIGGNAAIATTATNQSGGTLNATSGAVTGAFTVGTSTNSVVGPTISNVNGGTGADLRYQLSNGTVTGAGYGLWGNSASTYNGITANSLYLYTPDAAGFNAQLDNGSATYRINISGTKIIEVKSNGLAVTGVINLGVFTVGTLPNAGTSGQGATAFVTDSLLPAFGVAVANGGAVKVPVYSDGSAWIVG